MLRVIDSSSYCDFSGGGWKYLSSGTFCQGRIIDGAVISRAPNAKAWQIYNTAFSAYEDSAVLGAQATWYVGARLMFTMMSGPPVLQPGANIFLRFEYGAPSLAPDINDTKLPTTHCQLAVGLDAAGQLQFFPWSAIANGTEDAPGVPLPHVAFPPIVPSVWTYVEIMATFGAHGSIVLRIDDQEVWRQVNLTLGEPGIVPDRISRYWMAKHGSAVAWQDYYIADGQVTARRLPQDFLGPIRVTAHFPNYDNRVGWFRNTGLSDYSCVDDNPADLDATTIEGRLNEIDMFGLPSLPSFGQVLGVAANAAARRQAPGTPASIQLLCSPDPRRPTFTLNPDPWDPGANYCILHIASESNLADPSTLWTDGAIADAWWGLTAPSAGFVLATQYFVEKATSLRATPYSSGMTGSYSF